MKLNIRIIYINYITARHTQAIQQLNRTRIFFLAPVFKTYLSGFA